MEITQEVLDAIKAARAGYEAALDSLQAHKDAAEEAQKALDEVEKFLGIDVKPDEPATDGNAD